MFKTTNKISCTNNFKVKRKHKVLQFVLTFIVVQTIPNLFCSVLITSSINTLFDCSFGLQCTMHQFEKSDCSAQYYNKIDYQHYKGLEIITGYIRETGKEEAHASWQKNNLINNVKIITDYERFAVKTLLIAVKLILFRGAGVHCYL